MIFVRLKGGLGNQLFQYAAGLSLAKHRGTGVVLDIEWYSRFPERRYTLDRFNISGRTANFWERISLRLKDSFRESRHSFMPEILELPDGSMIEGTWESEKYFADIRDQIREEFTLRLPLSDFFNETAARIDACDAVSLHIRRGDRVAVKKVRESCGLMPVAYYERAAERMAEQIALPKFFIFSEDAAWAKENVKLPYPAEYVTHPQGLDYEEMLLMSHCKHHVIPNSTFSWWGAWLDPRPGKIVIAPTPWFLDASLDTSDKVPTGWERFPVPDEV
jgi:hypothetical protein